MPRKLPWQVKTEPREEQERGNSDVSAPSRGAKPDASATKRTKDDLENENDVDEHITSLRSKKVRDRARLMVEPPEEELMIDGYDADDGWRMVEDEFYMTARLFTAHLHAAEYRRLKKIAQEAGFSGSFYRGQKDLVASTAINALPASIKAGGKGKEAAVQVAEAAGDDEDPFMKDETLAAMMNPDRATKKFEKLVTRRPAAISTEGKAEAAVPAGWTARSSRKTDQRKTAQDLNAVSSSVSNKMPSLDTANVPAAPRGSMKSEPSTDMFIGFGRTASKLPEEISQITSTTKMSSCAASSTRSAALGHANTGLHEVPGSAKVSAAASSQQVATTAADTNEDLPGLQRTALNPRVLERLARRKRLAAGDG